MKKTIKIKFYFYDYFGFSDKFEFCYKINANVEIKYDSNFGYIYFQEAEIKKINKIKVVESKLNGLKNYYFKNWQPQIDDDLLFEIESELNQILMHFNVIKLKKALNETGKLKITKKESWQ